MRIEWQNNSANVGRLELRVRRSDFTGKWNTLVFLGLNQIGSHHEFESDAEARAWCEREALSIAGPLLDTARADGAASEREAFATRLDALLAVVESRVAGEIDPPAYRAGKQHLEELREIAEWVCARSNGGARIGEGDAK